MDLDTKVVIFAGGRGTRLSEETDNRPKPMVEIGGKPIIWHIMKIYSNYGFNNFIICLGYKGYVFKEYFANYFLHKNDVTIDLSKNEIKYHQPNCEPWKITLVDTGLDTLTGSRLKKIKGFLDDKTFMLTYGDGVSDINLEQLFEFHKSHGKLATLTAVQPDGKFGVVNLNNENQVSNFIEKPKGDGVWINGGFFVLEPKVIDYIDSSDQIAWEQEPLKRLAENKQLVAYKHPGFWKSMDNINDKNKLNALFDSGNALWLKK